MASKVRETNRQQILEDGVAPAEKVQDQRQLCFELSGETKQNTPWIQWVNYRNLEDESFDQEVNDCNLEHQRLFHRSELTLDHNKS